MLDNAKTDTRFAQAGPLATGPCDPPQTLKINLPRKVRLAITCALNGEVMQEADTSDLVIAPVDLVRYVSTILTLRPGDVIATGTPGGVGQARTPPRYLSDGDRLVTEIAGIGRLENLARSA